MKRFYVVLDAETKVLAKNLGEAQRIAAPLTGCVTEYQVTPSTRRSPERERLVANWCFTDSGWQREVVR